MKAKAYNPNAKFQTIQNACRTTGLSQYFLREGCKAGTVPHIKSGRVYMIDIEALYQQLETERVKRTGQ